jgi:hypothetical protein
MASLAHLLPQLEAWKSPYRMLERDPCPFCGRRMVLGTETEPTREHLTPRSRIQHTHEMEQNIVVTCSACNNEKCDSTLLEYLVAGGLRRVPHRNVRWYTNAVERARNISDDVRRVLGAAERHFKHSLWRDANRRQRNAVAWACHELELDLREVADYFNVRGKHSASSNLEKMAETVSVQIENYAGIVSKLMDYLVRSGIAVYNDSRGWSLPTQAGSHDVGALHRRFESIGVQAEHDLETTRHELGEMLLLDHQHDVANSRTIKHVEHVRDHVARRVGNDDAVLRESSHRRDVARQQLSALTLHGFTALDQPRRSSLENQVGDLEVPNTEVHNKTPFKVEAREKFSVRPSLSQDGLIEPH